MSAFLHGMFQRFAGAFRSLDEADVSGQSSCSGTLAQAIDHIVDQTNSRLRFLPGYARVLKEPVAATLRYIDDLVEQVPAAILCSRSAFSDDPRVSAFFVDPKHMQETFSGAAEVRTLVDANPAAEEIWALLCMRKAERRRLGMTLVDDEIHKDVMQTAVSFTDHQVLAPGISEADSRCSLKCCVLKRLLTYIRDHTSDERIRVAEMENRRASLVNQLKRAEAVDDGLRVALRNEIDALGKELAHEIPRLSSLEDQLEEIARVLRDPAGFVNGRRHSICLNRQGIKQDDDCLRTGNEISMFEIEVAAQGTRIAALVHFPVSELLPRQDFVRRADLFLAL